MESLPEVCQYLGDEHAQEKDVAVLKIHLETLFLLSTRGGVQGARLVKESGTYPVIRELHLQVDDEGVRRGCERLVDVLMGDDAVGGSHEAVDGKGDGDMEKVREVKPKRMGGGGIVTEDTNRSTRPGSMVTQVMEDEDEDEDYEIVPIF